MTGNCINRFPVYTEPACCKAFLAELKTLNQDWPSKVIAYVLMPDHFHLISKPREGDETLAVDHDWWWPDDSVKLSRAMKELGWYSYWKRKGET